jgi:hypothetical protein
VVGVAVDNHTVHVKKCGDRMSGLWHV